MLKLLKIVGIVIIVCSFSIGTTYASFAFKIKAKHVAAGIINTTGSPSAINTVYGDPSTSTSFTVSASGLTAGILVMPPTGFEVSTDNISFSNTVTIGTGGTVLAAPVYIRLAAITDAGTYNGNIALSSGTVNTNVVMPNSVISPAPVTVTTKDVTKNYGAALFISSTGTGTFTVTGTMKNGDQITTVSIMYGPGYSSADNVGTYPGSVTIITIAGNISFKLSNYQITQMSGSIIVLPAPLTIKLLDVTKTYGATFTNGTVSTGFTVTGIQNFQTVGTLNVSYGAGAAAGAVVNHYFGTLTASSPGGSNFTLSNYSITIVPADIVVKAAPLTISANDVSRYYGVNNPVLTATYSGFVNSENASALSVLPVITTTANINSDPGNYPITVGSASATNYIITYASGVLTVNPIPTAPVITLGIPNTFTPNGDGINDRWNITNIVSFPNCRVEIFNRNGQNVYTSIGYPTAWDGLYNGKQLPAGTYYYVIDLKNKTQRLGGSITLVR